MGADDDSAWKGRPVSVAEVIAEAWQANCALELCREDAAFLAGIHAYLDDSQVSGVDEDILRRIFAPVFELAQTGADSEVQRATMAIGRLRNQGILLRTDNAGLFGDGEFTLSVLGLALARSMEKERELTKRNLSFVLMHMRAVLVDVLRAATNAHHAQDWESQVIWPLRDIVIELIRMVEQRQRGLDAVHKALRKEVTELVDSEWAQAIDRCVDMVQRVDRTLRELNEVLSEHVEHLDRQLCELAAFCDKHPALPMLLDRTRTQLSRLARWGEQRYADWHGYYRNVQIFIRDVVQSDPDNLLRSRLSEQIRQYQVRPYGLLLVAPQPFLHLRDVSRPGTAAPLMVPDDVLAGQALSVYAAPPADEIDLAVAALVQRLKDDGEIDIVSAVLDVAPDFTDDEYYVLLVRATPALLQIGLTAQQVLEPVWTSLSQRLQAQSLELRTRAAARRAEDQDAMPFTPSLKKPDKGAPT